MMGLECRYAIIETMWFKANMGDNKSLSRKHLCQTIIFRIGVKVSFITDIYINYLLIIIIITPKEKIANSKKTFILNIKNVLEIRNFNLSLLRRKKKIAIKTVAVRLLNFFFP